MATVTATATLLESGGALEPRFVRGLQQDADRLERLLEGLRVLPRRPEASPEPLLLTDALAGARELISEHPDMDQRAVELLPVGDVQPVRADPGAVLHACAVAILAAARYTAAGTIRVRLETVGDRVHLRTSGDDGPHYGATALLEDDAEAIAWLLAGAHGTAEPHATGCHITLPTLAASRKAAPPRG
jgi:hypothetical protein